MNLGPADHVRLQFDETMEIPSLQPSSKKLIEESYDSATASPSTHPPIHGLWSKVLKSLAIILSMAITWAGTIQAGKSLYAPDFTAAFFTIWFSALWLWLLYPVAALVICVHRRQFLFWQLLREDLAVYNPSGYTTLKDVLKYSIPFALLYIGANYSFLRALRSISTADVTAIFSSNNVFVYILSVFLLKEALYLTRVIAVMASVSGVVMMAYTEGFKKASLIGVALTLMAALSSALYKVIFKLVVTGPNPRRVALFLTVVGVTVVVTMWPIVILLDQLAAETANWSNVPWRSVLLKAALGLLFNFLVNFGIAYTTPTLISLGGLLGIPLNTALDYIIWKEVFSLKKVLASSLIIIGFTLTILPEPILDRFDRTRWPRRTPYVADPERDGKAVSISPPNKCTRTLLGSTSL